jgi:hypothetical protein
MRTRETLFFNYSIDCELPKNTAYTGGEERCSFFGGPASWEFAERSVRGFIDCMGRLEVLRGGTLFVYPDVARHQRELFREMSGAGIEIGLHLHGLRYSRLAGVRAKWLGAMTRDEQRYALATAKADVEDALGGPCLGFRACYGSANDDTFPLCEELGFQWGSNSSGKCRIETFADWSESFPFPHFANRFDKRIPGDMSFLEIPVTKGLRTFFENDPNKPFDLRVETPPSMAGEDGRILRTIIDENLAEMKRQNTPVRTIIGASHNTNPYGDPDAFQTRNLEWIVRHARELASRYDLVFQPSSFAQITKWAQDRVRTGSAGEPCN